MNIVSVHKFYSDRDGASRYQLEVNRLLERMGHKVAPFAMALDENLPTPWSRFFPSAVRTQPPLSFSAKRRTFGRMLFGREPARMMRRLIAEFHPDVAHVHNVYTQLSPSVLVELRRANVPVVMTVHDYHLIAPNYMLWSRGRVDDFGRRGIVASTLSHFHQDSYAASFAQALTFHMHRRLGLYKKNVDLFLCPSSAVAERLRLAGFSEEKIRVLPLFVEVVEIGEATEGRPACQPELQRRLERSEGSSDDPVLFVGRFVEEKGVRFVLDLAAAMPETPFVLVGDGPLRDELETRAMRLGNVRIFPWASRDILRSYYRSARVVLVPSLWPEVFGLVALEAMAEGRPVIASDSGALPEIVQDGVTGRIVSAGDLDAWQSAIRSIQKNPARAEAMGQTGFLRAKNVFNPERHLAGLLKAFADVS